MPSVDGLLDLALAYHLAGDLGAEVSACEQATLLDAGSAAAWSRYAHALARTDRVSDAIDACDRALRLALDDEVAGLLARLREQLPRVLPAASVYAGANASRAAMRWCSRRPSSWRSARAARLAISSRSSRSSNGAICASESHRPSLPCTPERSPSSSRTRLSGE